MQWTVKLRWQWIRLGSRGLCLQKLGVVNVPPSPVVTRGPAVGLAAPIWSPHASFIGLSEAIFQNWLHLRLCPGARFSGWLMKGVVPRRLSALGGWGPAVAPQEAWGAWQAVTRTRSRPSWPSGCDQRPFLLLRVTSPGNLYSSL